MIRDLFAHVGGSLLRAAGAPGVCAAEPACCNPPGAVHFGVGSS